MYGEYIISCLRIVFAYGIKIHSGTENGEIFFLQTTRNVYIINCITLLRTNFTAVITRATCNEIVTRSLDDVWKYIYLPIVYTGENFKEITVGRGR